MAKVVMSGNGTSSSVGHTGGVSLIGVLGSLGGGELKVQYQTADMLADSHWFTVTSESAGVLGELAITTVNRPVSAPLPACLLRFVLSGATSPTATIYVDSMRR